MVTSTGDGGPPSSPERLARRLLARAHAVLSDARAAGAFAMALATLLAVGGVDFAIGYEISFSLFYLLPVAIATWYTGRTAGMAMAALSCVAWFAADLLSHP